MGKNSLFDLSTVIHLKVKIKSEKTENSEILSNSVRMKYA